MSLNKWMAGALVGVTLGALGLATPPAKADEGARVAAKPGVAGVVWLGSLSTGYTVGQDVERGQQMTIVYTRVPIAHMLVQDAHSGCVLFEGKPKVGQSFWFDQDTNIKFTVWSHPTKEYPPMSASATAISSWGHERPIIDALEMKVVQ